MSDPEMTGPGERDVRGEEPAPPGVRTLGAVRWGLVALAALAAAGTWTYFVASRSAGPVRSAVRYQCPMHPSIVEDHPASCPICGMDLVPAAAAEAGASDVPGLAPVRLDGEQVQLLGMRTARVERRRLEPALRASGTVAPAEGAVVVVTARFPGWVEQVGVAQTGQLVRKGEVLARVTGPDLEAAQQAYLAAGQWGRDREREHAGVVATEVAQQARERILRSGISDRDLRELEHTGKPLPSLAIVSPLGGYVTRRAIYAGQLVQAGSELFDVADLSTVWIVAEVHESRAAALRPGQPVTVTLPALAGERFAGKVDLVYPGLGAGGRWLPVRVAVPNPELKLRPGMSASVAISLGGAEVLAVPADAIVDTGDAQYAFVAGEGGRFAPRPVRVGAGDGERVAVLAGLSEGEAVAAGATFLLDSESRIQATRRQPVLAAPPGAAGTEGTAPAAADAPAPAGAHPEHR